MPFWGPWGPLAHVSLFGELSVFSAPEKVSISPQRGAIFQRWRFCEMFEISGKWSPLRGKRAYRCRGATLFGDRTIFSIFLYFIYFCTILPAREKYAYRRRGAPMFEFDRTVPSGRDRKKRPIFCENERLAYTRRPFSLSSGSNNFSTRGRAI